MRVLLVWGSYSLNLQVWKSKSCYFSYFFFFIPIVRGKCKQLWKDIEFFFYRTLPWCTAFFPALTELNSALAAAAEELAAVRCE